MSIESGHRRKGGSRLSLKEFLCFQNRRRRKTCSGRDRRKVGCGGESCPLCLVLQRWQGQNGFLYNQKTTGNRGRSNYNVFGKASLDMKQDSNSRLVHAHHMTEPQCLKQHLSPNGIKICIVILYLTHSKEEYIYLTFSRFQSLCQVVPEWKQQGGQLSCPAAIYGKRLW